MVDITIEGNWFASVRVCVDASGAMPGENEFVAQAQADLAKQGYVLDNDVTYAVRDPNSGEQTVYAPDA